MKGMPTGTAGRFLLETVYLVHHSHMDIGYTDLADEVREQHLSHRGRGGAVSGLSRPHG